MKVEKSKSKKKTKILIDTKNYETFNTFFYVCCCLTYRQTDKYFKPHRQTNGQNFIGGMFTKKSDFYLK